MVQLQHISTNEQIANILTKPLSKKKFVYFKDKLGVVENFSLGKRECLCLGKLEAYILEDVSMVLGLMGHSLTYGE